MSKKLIALVLAVTFAFSFVAKGATVEELQAQIAALMAQIQTLQAQLGQQTTTTGACFTMDLKLGMKNDDVKTLQIKLGVTPATGYFGPLTLAAVKKFQAENGIPTTGYVGPLTRTALNSKFCAPPPTVPPTTAPTTPPTTSVAPSYGTLSVVSYPVSNPASTFYAGGTYDLFAAQFKATGSDITVKKIGFDLNVAGSNIFPWQVFSTISLWDGNTKLAEVAVTQDNLIQDTFASHYWLNVSGFNWVIPNGQTKVLTVRATLLSTIPSTVITNGSGYTVAMNNGIVYSDTAGVTYSTVNVPATLTKTVNNIKASNAANLTASLASDNPLMGNVIASTGATTKVDVLKFNVKNDSDVSATLNSGSALVTVSASTTQNYITAVELWDGSTLVASAGPTTWSTNSHPTSSVSWTNFTLPIAANTTKTLTVKAVIAQIPTTDTTFVPGSWVQVSTISFTGIDSNSNVVPTDLSTFAALSGNEQYIYVKAPTFTFTNATFTSSGDQTNPQSVGNSKITFTVTANGDDIYIDPNNTFATTTPVVSNASGTVANGFTCTSNATQDSTNGWRITSGSTATCELDTTIQLSTTTAGAYYQVQVNQVTWKVGTNGNPVTQKYGWDNFKTGLTYLAHN